MNRITKAKKEQRIRALYRLLYFVLAGGSIASVIVLTMLISDSDIETATNAIALLNLGGAVYFVNKLIFE